MTVIVELRPDCGVIGCSGGATRFQIHLDNAADCGQRRGSQNVIDAPSPIVLKSVAEVVPIGILHAIGVEMAENVSKSPADGVAIGFACLDVKVRIVDATIRMVNIDRLGSNVQIADPNGRLVLVADDEHNPSSDSLRLYRGRVSGRLLRETERQV